MSLKNMNKEEAIELHGAFKQALDILRIRAIRGDKIAARELMSLMTYQNTIIRPFGWRVRIDNEDGYEFVPYTPVDTISQ